MTIIKHYNYVFMKKQLKQAIGLSTDRLSLIRILQKLKLISELRRVLST